MIRLILSFLILISSSVFAASEAEIKKNMEESLNYLEATQIKETIGDKQFLGEWPSFMMNDNTALFLGMKGKKAYDSNAFTTASIHNNIAKTYLAFPEYEQIPPLLEKAIKNVLMYQVEDRFGFWPLLPGNRDPSKLLRRPNHYVLINDFINNASNVPEDADDTAVAYLALKLNEKITNQTLAPEKIGYIFSKHRDEHRRSLHYYNVINGQNIFTGAFLTWLSTEPTFTPWSWLPIHHKKAYIPYGANEVDCVVNSNVLGTLAHFNELETPGVKEACRLVEKAVKRDNFGMCGVYYPNSFNMPYAATKAFTEGATCLASALPGIKNFLLKNQHADGSFSYEVKNQKWKGFIVKKINGVYKKEPVAPTENERAEQELQNLPYDETIDPKDTLQSSIYAVSALLSLPEKDEAVLSAIERGVDYILSNANEKDGQLFWRGGVFFAGGTLVRGDIRWRSDAYTTSLVLELLTKYRILKNL